MELDISTDRECVGRCLALWTQIESQLLVPLENIVMKDAYINPKFKSWEGKFKTNVHEFGIPFQYIVIETIVLKIRSVYKQGGNYYLQVFVNECKIIEPNTPAESFLDSSEANS